MNGYVFSLKRKFLGARLPALRPASIRMIVALLLLGLLSGWGQAQRVSVADFFERLQNSPDLRGARAALFAAEAAVAQARKAVAVDVSAGANSRSDLSAANVPVATVGAGLTAYPFSYGAQGEVVRTRELELDQARLQYRQVRAQLEAKALRSAFELHLSQRALGLARRGAAAATHLLETARLRQAAGVAGAADVQRAEAEQVRQQNLVLTHAANLELAQRTLTALVGSARLSTLPALRVPQGTPASLRSSDVAVQLAQLGAAGATRPFYPVVDVTYNLDLSAESRLSASLSSRDLAPRVGYSYVSDGYDDGVGLSVRLSTTLSPDQFQNVTRLEQHLAAAEANRQAAARDAAAQEGQLQNRVAETVRNEALATYVFENAERALQEVRQRQAVGVVTSVETQQAVVALANAGASLFDSVYDTRRQHFNALLELYTFYGVPVSEGQP